MPARVSAAVQLFLSVLPAAYSAAGNAVAYADFDNADKVAICDAIRLLLSDKNWAFAKKSTYLALQFATMFATDTRVSLDVFDDKSPLAQANKRNQMLEEAAKLIENKLGTKPSALKRALAHLGLAESIKGLSNEPTSKRMRPAFSTREAEVAKRTERGRLKAINTAAMQLKTDRIANQYEPLLNETFCGTVICESLLPSRKPIHARYVDIRARIAGLTDGLGPYYEEFKAVVKQHFDEKYWMPTHVSTEAVQAIRAANPCSNPGLPGKICRPVGDFVLTMGHGTTGKTLSQGEAMKRLFRQGVVESEEAVLAFVYRNNMTVIITAAQNAVEVQLRPDEMHELPAEGTLFWRSGWNCKLGTAEIAWVNGLPVA
jgi:hypothetical protein